MRWVVDLDALVDEGVLGADQARKVQERARGEMIAFTVNLLLFAGMICVVGGASYWLRDAGRIAVFGAVLTVPGLAALTFGNRNYGLVANSCAVIGASMAIIGSLIWLGANQPSDPWPSVIGLGVILVGWLIWRWGGVPLRFLAGCLLFGGVLLHLFGVIGLGIGPVLPILELFYAGVLLAVCGMVIDVRFVTALSVIPLAGALSARAQVGQGMYGLYIGEPALTIVLMGGLIGVCGWQIRGHADRLARHWQILAVMGFLVANVVFWIGSVWGDVVGNYLWGPGFEAFGLPGNSASQSAFRQAEAAFEAGALTISADVFAIVWALALAGAAAFAAATGRRTILNMVTVFGGIHFYTQYFTRLEMTPGAFAIAGVTAILGAWALWSYNGAVKAREGARAG